MASAKDTFESKTFAANTFACGTWRGSGVDALPPRVTYRPASAPAPPAYRPGSAPPPALYRPQHDM